MHLNEPRRRRLSRKSLSALAVPVAKPQENITRKPIFWLATITYALLWVGVIALTVSFLVGYEEIPVSPTELLVDESGDYCGTLGENCNFQATDKPTYAPTPFPTTPTQSSAPTAAPPTRKPTTLEPTPELTMPTPEPTTPEPTTPEPTTPEPTTPEPTTPEPTTPEPTTPEPTTPEPTPEPEPKNPNANPNAN
ncbi:Hypothetical Protein FCC1311_058642 [Hondaea fermentalgiana]|uniref:Uncharacterized protein n=1 Tax=Hondaea fermentalgiana TaxID=2315210 RepID=A0A2R5GLY9_9STRA|nr:Hypothetical Protein FCC1311_058642 [Hondaea fermentalgiana]|eukprot:GBG29643.1 Hypothetical Protein FCC1311_058642 [Hondaea fermentalgiana]